MPDNYRSAPTIRSYPCIIALPSYISLIEKICNKHSHKKRLNLDKRKLKTRKQKKRNKKEKEKEKTKHSSSFVNREIRNKEDDIVLCMEGERKGERQENARELIFIIFNS